MRWIIGTIALPIIIVAITYIPKSPNPPTQTTNTIPFVELTPFSIVNKGKEFNPNGDNKEKETVFHLKLKVKNHGQSPTSIEKTYVWIENILENSKNLVIWNANELYARKKFVLFQNEEEELNLKIYLGKSDMDKIKNKKTVYFGFYIIYNTPRVAEDIQNGPFYYWAIYRCYNFIPNKEGTKYRFLIEASGVTKIDPTSHNLNLKPKTGTDTIHL